MFDADDIAAFFDPDMPGYAVATFAGGVEVPGLFGNGYAEAFGGNIGGTTPAFTCASASVASYATGTSLTINDVSYTVAGDIERNSVTGKAVLRLREA